MIYVHKKTGMPYQFEGVAHLVVNDPASERHDAVVLGMNVDTVKLARDSEGNIWAYLDNVYDDIRHLPVWREATLVIESGRVLTQDLKCVVYRDEAGNWLVSPEEEFFDGRFAAFGQPRTARKAWGL